MKKYFNQDGTVTHGEKYKHLATHTVDMPVKEDREGYSARAKLNLDTLEGYWEYIKIPKSEEERLEELEQSQSDQDDLLMDIMLGGM